MAPSKDTASVLEDWEGSEYFQIEHDPQAATLWITLTTRQKPCLRRQLIEDFNALAAAIRLEHGRMAPSPNQPIKFVVLRSDSDRVFNLGGDLDHFVEAIDTGSLESLRHYGKIGAAGCLALASGFDASIITISLVKGIAVGGGFEVARCCNYMVAEADAVFQLPEASFGLFPASGIISIISPRIGPKATRELVVEGRRMTLCGRPCGGRARRGLRSWRRRATRQATDRPLDAKARCRGRNAQGPSQDGGRHHGRARG